MKRMLLLLGAATLAASLTAASPAVAAPNGPARYQVTTTTYQVMVLNAYEHDYTITNNPCDGSITITGGTPTGSGYYTTETVTGSQSDGVINFNSLYNGPYNRGYSYSGSFPVGGGPLSGDYTGTVTQTGTTTSTYANHGQYVSSAGGGSDAAHSCVGMPVQGNA